MSLSVYGVKFFSFSFFWFLGLMGFLFFYFCLVWMEMVLGNLFYMFVLFLYFVFVVGGLVRVCVF